MYNGCFTTVEHTETISSISSLDMNPFPSRSYMLNAHLSFWSSWPLDVTLSAQMNSLRREQKHRLIFQISNLRFKKHKKFEPLNLPFRFLYVLCCFFYMTEINNANKYSIMMMICTIHDTLHRYSALQLMTELNV